MYNTLQYSTVQYIPVLGPLLYTIYINELSENVVEDDCQELVHKDDKKLFPKNCSKCGQIPSYADDATLTISAKTREENQIKIDKTMSRITTFLNSNQLTINKTKTNILECMVAQKRARLPDTPPELQVIGQNGEQKIIKTQEQIRLLGTNLSRNLGWKDHLESGEKALLPEIRKLLGGLNYTSKQIPISSRILLANGLIMSKFHYAIPLWGGYK